MQEHESDIAERIAAARREAEALKDRIKLRKEALADATCKRQERKASIRTHLWNQCREWPKK